MLIALPSSPNNAKPNPMLLWAVFLYCYGKVVVNVLPQLKVPV